MYRAILVISIGQEKVKRFSRRELPAQVRRLAQSLRHSDVRGVREVHAIRFTDWRVPRGQSNEPPWRPYGALVSVEAEDAGTLTKYVDKVWGVASKVDQEMMSFTPVDDW